MVEGYFKAREAAKKREGQWTLKQRLLNYALMFTLIISLALYPVLGLIYLIVFCLLFIFLVLIIKVLLSQGSK